MKNDQMKFTLGGIVIGGFLVWVIMMSTVNSNNIGMMGMMGVRTPSQPYSSQNSNTIDSHFIEQMIPHHEDAITMAKLALERATHQEIIDLSNSIIESQSKENEMMKEWYKEWFGKDVPTGVEVMGSHGMMSRGSGMHMGMMGGDADIEDLKSSTDFDREFIRQMIPHHQMAIMMSNMLEKSTKRSEMKKLAEGIVSAQTKEINQMREWYKQWEY